MIQVDFGLVLLVVILEDYQIFIVIFYHNIATKVKAPMRHVAYVEEVITLSSHHQQLRQYYHNLRLYQVTLQKSHLSFQV